jgi:hypothetical protein
MRSFGYGRVEEEENRAGAGWREGPIVRTAHGGYGERQGEGQGQGAKSVARGQAHPTRRQVGQVAPGDGDGESDETRSSRGDCATVQFGGSTRREGGREHGDG